MNRIQSIKNTNPLTGNHIVYSIRPIDLKNFTKAELISYFENSYDIYETLFSSLCDDSVYCLCPDRLRLPLIFYYGHTSAVFVNKLVLSDLIRVDERINLDYETMFETGVDEMSWDDIEHYRMGGSYKWPYVEQVKDYRKKVRSLILRLIDRLYLNLPVTMNDQTWALFMGFEHERIHYETSTVLIRQYPIHMVKKPDKWSYAPLKLDGQKEFIINNMIKVPKTRVKLGKPLDFPSYGWDNEYGNVDCFVDAFEAAKYKTTNEQFMEFVLDQGYQKRQYWSDEGWQWVQFKQAKHPLFWVCSRNCKSGCGGKIENYSHCQPQYFTQQEMNEFENNQGYRLPFKLRLMFDLVEMPKNWPVEVNYHEAKAFCNWKGNGYRLITEAEHHAIRDTEPVNMFPSNSKGFNDVFGNVWEWCEDNFNGLPGSETHYMYDDFSTPCYDGRHNLIMGSSWASTGDEASRFARFMFRRHFYQHCGFRCVRSLPKNDGSKPNPQVRLVKDNIYILGASYQENKSDMDSNLHQLNYFETTNKQYLYDSHLHPELLENELVYNYIENNWFEPFMIQIKNLIKSFDIDKKSAIHLGCSTGNVCFELKNLFKNVVGVDFCAKFLQIAETLKTNKKLEIKLSDSRVISIDVLNDQNENRIEFKQMTWIPNEIEKSDLVIFSMIDRCMSPKTWLKRLREIVKPKGILVIQSRESKYETMYLRKQLKEFKLINETSINGNDSFTVWKLK